MHPDHRVPYIKGIVTRTIYDMHRGYLAIIRLQDIYYRMLLRDYRGMLSRAYDIPIDTLFKQYQAVKRSHVAEYMLDEFLTPTLYEYDFASLCIGTMGSMASKRAGKHPIFRAMGYNLHKSFLVMSATTAPRNAIKTINLIHQYRLTYDEIANLLSIRYLTPWKSRICVDEYPFPTPKLPILSHLRCTSGEFMNMYKPQSSVMHFTEIKGTKAQDLTYRLMFAPYEDHKHMFNATDFLPKEERLYYISDRKDRNFKLDELSFFREKLYPYYEGMVIKSGDEIYNFPEGRRRSFMEIATDPEFYKALQNDDLTVIDIAHMQGMNLGQFRTLMIDTTLFLDNWVHNTQCKEKVDFTDDLEHYYRDFRNGDIKYAAMYRYRHHLWTYIREAVPFCRLFFNKCAALQLEIITIYGIDPLNDVDAMYKCMAIIRKKERSR